MKAISKEWSADLCQLGSYCVWVHFDPISPLGGYVLSPSHTVSRQTCRSRSSAFSGLRALALARHWSLALLVFLLSLVPLGSNLVSQEFPVCFHNHDGLLMYCSRGTDSAYRAKIYRSWGVLAPRGCRSGWSIGRYSTISSPV